MMNRDAQKSIQTVPRQASKYTGFRGGDVNIRALHHLDKNHQYFLDLAKLQEVKTTAAAVTSYPSSQLSVIQSSL